MHYVARSNSEVYKKELWDAGFNLPSGYFEIKIEELKDYVYREEIDCFIENKKK